MNVVWLNAILACCNLIQMIAVVCVQARPGCIAIMCLSLLCLGMGGLMMSVVFLTRVVSDWKERYTRICTRQLSE